MSEYINPEPTPKKNEYPAVWDLVMEDMKDRDYIGLVRYGTRLQPFNGRNSLVDLTEELLDAMVYLRQFREEINCIWKEIKLIHDVLAESQFLEKEDCVKIADSLMQSLKKSPAFLAE